MQHLGRGNSIITRPLHVVTSCSKCSEAGSPGGPQSPASGPSEAPALPRGHVRSRSRDRPRDVTWTRDKLSQGRLHSSDGDYQ